MEAAAAFGGIIISSFFQVLFDRILPGQIWDFFGAGKLDGLRSDLQKTLIAVNNLIPDAEDKQFDYPLVRQWLQTLQGAVYEAEDLLDAVNTEAMQIKQKQSNTRKRPRFLADREMEAKLNKVLEQLKDLKKQKDQLGLKEGVGEKPSQRRETTSLMGDTDVYGRDSDKEAIKKLLLSNSRASDNNLDVITIKGMGGLGKTALAQLVYNDDRVKDHFGFRAWVCISEELDVFKVTRNILEAVSSSNSPSTNSLDLIQIELQKSLSEKKFLLVLDDVWNEDPYHWELLKKPLLHGAKGSKILVTTRNEGVAAIMRTVPIYNLQKLSKEDGWKLFAKRAFEDGVSLSPALQEIGRKIVEKCGGLPLAVKVLGGLLRYKRTLEEWVKVLESNMWELKDAKSNILPVLRVSYHYLPPHLKQCFAYSFIYPKDHEFGKEELIRLWMAQGFLLHPEGRKTMEELGDEYFNELVSRSFFQHSTAWWKRECFVMHDLINDLANFVYGKLCFCMQRGSTLQDLPATTRHLSYSWRRLNQFADIPKANCLRTFLPVDSDPGYLDEEVPNSLDEEVSNNLLEALRLVRVLSLNSYNISELPESIGNLKHLRYLDLSRTNIKRLADSVCNLYNLQTLLLRCCSDLIELPENMWKLVNLRYLDIKGCNKLGEMPINIGRLKNLRRLDFFIVGKSSIKELGQLSELQGDLKIGQLQNVVSTTDAAEARLNDKKYLGCLKLKWSEDEHYGSREEYNVLEKLQPHSNLKGLGITSYWGPRFPDWVGGPTYSNMEFVELKNCRCCHSLPALGRLPSLKRLHIEGLSGLLEVGADFYGNGNCAFGSLEVLCFCDMCEWEVWCRCDVEKAFPLLRVLVIENCPKLKGDLPFCLPSLTKLYVSYCPALGGSLFPRASLLGELRLVDCGLMVWNEPLQGLKSLEMRNLKDEASESFLAKVMLTSTCLETLDLTGCSSLTSLAEMKSTCHLKQLHIRDCSSLTSLPEMNSTYPLESLSISNCSSLTCLPEMKSMCHLKQLHIRDCSTLTSLPEMNSTCPLEWLSISNCSSLTSLAEMKSTCHLKRLEIKECSSLTSLPEMNSTCPLKRLSISSCPSLTSLAGMKSTCHLKDLNIHECSSLTSLLEMNSTCPLQTLHISYCSSLTSLPEMKSTCHLKHLNIHDCFSLTSLPEMNSTCPLESLSIYNCSSLTSLPEMKSTCHLKHLNIHDCSSLTSLPEMNFTHPLQSLSIVGCSALTSMKSTCYGKHLKICDCSSLTSLPEMNSTCPLKSLYISGCSSLMCLPKKIGLLSSLKSISIVGGKKLELPTGHQFAALEDLEIYSCDTLRSFPLNLFPKLRTLVLSRCENLESFSDSELSQLTQLEINGCPKLSIDCSSMKLLGERQTCVLPSTLTSLEISNCNKLEELLAFGLISGLPCLTHLTIGGPCEGVKSFPQEGCLPTSLNSLTIDDFSDLETLQYKGLHHLTSLSSLTILCCDKLQCLPQEGLPISLSSLHIGECPLLVQRLQIDKIASIPVVLINGRKVLK